MVEEVSVPQRAGEKRFGSIVQLLETPKGELASGLPTRPAALLGGGPSRFGRRTSGS